MGNCKDCNNQCDCDDIVLLKEDGENLAESIHHDCCWFARRGKIEICQKRKIEFIQDIHGIIAESCQNCDHYSYAR